MKKLVLMIAAVAAMTFVSCDQKKAENANGEATDSTKVEAPADTTAADTTVAAEAAEAVAEGAEAVAEGAEAAADAAAEATK